jgi:hypothetical protein
MTTKQQKLAQAIREGKITDKTTASVFVMVEELNDRLDEEIPQIKNILKKVKGDVGEKGSKGDRGEQGIQGIQGIQGNPGTKGDKGLKGDTPTIDTAKIALEASNMAIEAIKPSIPDIKDISDELPQLGTQIRDSLELLIGKEKLDKSAIYGLENYDEISQLAKQPKGIFGGGGSPAGALRMDGSNSPMADISWGSYKITNLATPTSDYDASTKKYVDDSVSVENLWDRSGTTLSPNNVGDNVLLTGTLGAGATTGTSFIIGANTLDTNEWAFLDGQNQTVKTTSSPTFVGIDLSTEIAGAIQWSGGSKLYEQSSSGMRMLYQPNGDRFEVLTKSGAAFIAGFHGSLSALTNSIRLYHAVAIGGAAGYAQSGTLPTGGLVVLGSVGCGTNAPTAVLHLKAGTATAGTAPLKFTSGVSLTTAEAGAMEFTTDDFFATITTGVARKAFVLDDGTRLTSTKVPVAFTNGRLIDSSLYSDGADNWWVGDGTGLPYGSCYGHMIGWTQATAVQNTWYNISDTDMTDGELNLIAHDGSGKLTVTKAGRYLINYSVCFNSSENSTHIESGIEISGSGSANAAGIMCFDTHERLSVTSGTAVIDLAASATIEVCVRTTSAGTPTLTCESLNISAIMVGGT